MNKGLFIHIIASIIYCLMVMYVVQEHKVGVAERCLIVFLLIMTNFIVFANNDYGDNYKKNL
jgi:hypothetical membrane protein